MAVRLVRSPERVVRVQVRLPAQLHDALEACADRSGLSTVGLIRVILDETLAGSPATAAEALRSRRGAADVVALAALVSSEHAVKLLELATPGGLRYSREAHGAAFEAAEQRLQDVRAQIEAAS
jgi:hypothetical protein